MKLLSEFFPIVLFFLAYKLYGIYWATGTALVVALVQSIVHWVRYRNIDQMQLLTLVLIMLLGGATLVLHNEMFIKWKPTAINWAFALLFLSSQFIGQKPFIQRLMDQNICLPRPVWQRLNFGWVIFFGILGAANLYVAYHYNTNVWVNFKLFGILGLTLVFVIIQALYMMRFIKQEQQGQQT